MPFLNHEENRMTRVAVALLTLVVTFSAFGLAADEPPQDPKIGHWNKVLKPGDPAPSFNNLPSADGKKVSLADFKDKDVVVLVVTCNHCPVAQAYQDRIIDLTRKYADKGVAVVAINCTDPAEAEGQDTLEKMTERAREKHFNFPYLQDASGKVGKALGASVTPEFFVLNKERKVVYLGAFDNANGKDGFHKATTNYLEPAVKAALEGKMPEINETAGHGCGVLYARGQK
jgi:peroxiredoxin